MILSRPPPSITMEASRPWATAPSDVRWRPPPLAMRPALLHVHLAAWSRARPPDPGHPAPRALRDPPARAGSGRPGSMARRGGRATVRRSAAPAGRDPRRHSSTPRRDPVVRRDPLGQALHEADTGGGEQGDPAQIDLHDVAPVHQMEARCPHERQRRRIDLTIEREGAAPRPTIERYGTEHLHPQRRPAAGHDRPIIVRSMTHSHPDTSSEGPPGSRVAETLPGSRAARPDALVGSPEDASGSFEENASERVRDPSLIVAPRGGPDEGGIHDAPRGTRRSS